MLESFCWDYLVKVKLKNLEKLLQAQTWAELKGKKDAWEELDRLIEAA